MFVLKIGGSTLFDDQRKIKKSLISEYVKTIKNLFTKKKFRFTLVIGGGTTARKYIASLRKLGATEAYSDIVGIEAAKLNARLIIGCLGSLAYPHPPSSFQEFLGLYYSTEKIIVCGGFQPGQSTNAVASIIAEAISAKKLINITDVAGVYSSDPDTNKDAKLLQEVSVAEFKKMIAQQKTKAGHYPLFDMTAIQIIERSNIKLQFIDGTDITNLQKVLAGKSIGTLVTN
jgi:uridylate kinase